MLERAASAAQNPPMRAARTLLSLALGALLAALFLPGCGRPAPESAGPPADDSIYATTYPLFWATDRLLGGERRVTLALMPGADPAHWEPSRELLERLQRARLIVVNGAGLEGWRETGGLPRSRTVVTTAPFRDRLLEGEATAHSHGPAGEHTHAPLLPATWVDPNNLRLQVGSLAEALAELEPGAAPAIAERRRELDDSLRALDRRWLELAPRLRKRELFALDDSYAYLAERYALPLEVLAGDDPPPASPRGLLWVDGPDQEAPGGGPESGPRTVRVDVAAALPRDAAADGRDYLDVMQDNLDRLAAALDEAR